MTFRPEGPLPPQDEGETFPEYVQRLFRIFDHMPKGAVLVKREKCKVIIPEMKPGRWVRSETETCTTMSWIED